MRTNLLIILALVSTSVVASPAKFKFCASIAKQAEQVQTARQTGQVDGPAAYADLVERKVPADLKDAFLVMGNLVFELPDVIEPKLIGQRVMSHCSAGAFDKVIK